MAVTNYYGVEGRILGEATGGTRTDYAPDALGSVAATVDQSSAVVNQYAYKPYGGQLSKTGVGADPSFRWVGSLGYRHTSRSRCEAYVRARHYDQRAGRWTSADPTWPGEPAYGYGSTAPTVFIDPSGTESYTSCCCCADSLQISNVKQVHFQSYLPGKSGEFFGYYFDLPWLLTYPKYDKPLFGDCRYEWWEQSPNGVRPFDQRDVWVPQHINVPFAATFREWRKRKKQCCGQDDLKFFDEPARQKKYFIKPNQQAPTGYVLYINVAIKSNSLCNCIRELVSVRIRMVLVRYPVNPPSGADAEGFIGYLHYPNPTGNPQPKGGWKY